MKNQILVRNKTIKLNYPEILFPQNQNDKNVKSVCKTKLTEKEIELKEKILSDDAKFHHVHHCVQNLVRIPYQVLAYKNFSQLKAFQFGLNIGRAQEIVENVGGIEYWWRNFKDEIESENWSGLLEKAKDRFNDMFGSLDLLDNEELDRLL